jgi:hypothetical protein
MASAGYSGMEAGVKGWDELILDIRRANARYLAKLIEKHKARFH